MNTPSWSFTVGRILPMSMRRLANWWLASGSTWLLNRVRPKVTTPAAASGPARTLAKLTPLARNAVISLSWDSRPNVMSTATSTAHGTDRATM